MNITLKYPAANLLLPVAEKQKKELSTQQILDLVKQGQLSRLHACSRLFSVGYETDKQGKRADAFLLYEKAIELIDGSDIPVSRVLPESSVAALAFNHGKTLIGLGRYRFAISAFKRCSEAIESALGNSLDFLWTERRALAEGWVAFCKRKSGFHSEAVECYDQAIATWRSLEDLLKAPVSPYSANIAACLMGKSCALRELGDHRGAAELKRQAEKLFASINLW